jgi:RNA polymerase sigma factor (sigma-70 family)
MITRNSSNQPRTEVANASKEFTQRERGLLKAWDARHQLPVNHSLEERVMNALHRARQSPLDAPPPLPVDAVMNAMAAEADEVCQEVQAANSRSNDPDSDIVKLIDRGERVAALTALMRRHGTAVYRYCRVELRDRMLADDVHQQIFIQAHRDLLRFARRATLRTWLFGIAWHRVLDAAKSQRRAQSHIEGDDTADTRDPRLLPGEQLDEARLQHALIQCLRVLGDHVRCVLILRYQQGFTFEELSEIFHEKPGTLQARVSRALPLLRDCIEARTRGIEARTRGKR